MIPKLNSVFLFLSSGFQFTHCNLAFTGVGNIICKHKVFDHATYFPQSKHNFFPKQGWLGSQSCFTSLNIMPSHTEEGKSMSQTPHLNKQSSEFDPLFSSLSTAPHSILALCHL